MQPVTEILKLVQSAIHKEKFKGHPSSLYEPVRYIMQIGGKRLRPVLVLIACEMAGGKSKDALKPAIGIELFHNFTLLHDDLMDEAPLRRGKPTVHHKFDSNRAVLSGDVMFVMAYRYVTSVKPSLLPRVLKVFDKTAIKVCEGQQLDMTFESTDQVVISEYLDMISRKTAALLAGSLQIGAITGNAPEPVVKALGRVGIDLGIAFQLQDDLLDTFGDPEKFGKQVGGDIVQNKKTYLLVRALEKGSEIQVHALKKWLGENPSSGGKVEAVTRIFRELQVDEDARSLRDQFFHRAMDELSGIEMTEERKKPLRDLAHELLNRDK